MRELHCSRCKRFLLKIEYGKIEIKCPNSKCKNINKYLLVTHKMLLQLTEEEQKQIINK